MEICHERCCGLDVHQKTIVACFLASGAKGHVVKEIRTFSTMTPDILALADWLTAQGCTHIAMESTGIYWKPIYNLLEGSFELLVANAHHLKSVPGRKTDVRDAEWIADLLRHGLLQSSFIPPAPQREVREITRHRSSLVMERARILNRIQKVLEDANIKLGAVVSDILGVSARAMLEALIAGVTDTAQLADLARGKLRHKQEQLVQALCGRFQSHHAFLIAEHLSHVDYLDEAIERATTEIERRLTALGSDVELLDTIPGVNQRIAQIVLAEIGADMSRFPSACHLASWAGICPGNNESAGKRYSGRTRKGSKWLRQVLMEAAHAAVRTKETYPAAQYRRLAARRGKKRALVAVAHTLLTIMYYVLKRQEPYRELGGNYFDERDRSAVKRRLVKRLQNLGYNVSLESVAPAA
jgi:transposase